MHGVLHRLAAGVIAAIPLLAITGCGSTPVKHPATTVRVTTRDFRISAPKRVPAGDVRLLIRNKGPVSHEVLVVRGSKSRLPYRKDGLGVDEDALGSALVAVLEPSEPGVHELKVRLAPGHYRFLCNMSGHYMGGMKTDVVAR